MDEKAAREAELAKLKEQIRRLQAELDSAGGSRTTTGGGAAIGGDINTGGGDVIGRDQFNIHLGVYKGPRPSEPEQVEKIYRQVLASRCGELPLQGIDAETADATSGRKPLSLTHIYIALNTRHSIAEQRSSGRSRSLKDLVNHEREPRRQSALEAVIAERQLVLLGDPGSGKTTFVNHLAHALAVHDFEHLPGWPTAERNSLPILIILRDLARWLTDHEGEASSARLLWDYVSHDLHERKVDFAEQLLQDALEAGSAIILLDGLDEVPPAAGLSRIQDSILAFLQRYPDNRYLATCRVLSYQQPQWQLPAATFPTVELAPFDKPQIDGFIDAWYKEVSRQWNEPPSRTEPLAAKLRIAVRRPDLWRLAPNPLLLTVMAVVHTHDSELPDARALLYKKAVEVLLWRWDQRKATGAVGLLDRLREQRRNERDLISELERLAFQAHGQGGVGEDAEAVAGIGELGLLKAFQKLHARKSLDWAQELVETLKLRAGLLLEREPGVFAFPHRTFQEYLAGSYLARQPNFSSEVTRLIEDHGGFWRQVILLAIGSLVHDRGEYEKPLALVGSLCPATRSRTEQDWRNTWLAGEVLLEMGVNRAEDTEQGEALLQRVCTRLTSLLEQGKLTARERAEVGDVLGQLGDSRFDPACFHLPCRYRNRSEPLAGFVKIPAGPFVMGSREGDDEARNNEFGNPDTLSIDYPYWIARYPVTVAQYADFLESGHEAPEGWSAQQVFPNRPVVNVSWHDALAYCDWLSERLRDDPRFARWFERGYRVTLPTEAEWEKAARNGDDRRYPWGNEAWNSERANILGEIGRPTAVGMYPRGRTPGDLHDCSGNVWEWTLSEFHEYPYRPQGTRGDGETGDAALVLRGGSWIDDLGLARCASRLRLHPAGFCGFAGFRLVFSLAEY